MELIAILTASKEMGFDVGHLISIAAVYLMLRKDLRKFVTAQNEALIKVVNTQIDKVVDAIKDHNKRIDSLEESVSDLKKRIGNDTNR